MTERSLIPSLSRRDLLTSAAILGAAATLPMPLSSARGQTGYVRYRVDTADAARHVNGYMTAIKTMLALPEDNPHNWYRQAFIHLLDCPHGNWWFLPWHLGYLGNFEIICRKYSGMNDFALPFWDWTLTPEVPKIMTNNDPLNPAKFNGYKATYDQFKGDLQGPINRFWDGLDDNRRQKLEMRGYSSVNDIWDAIEDKAKHGKNPMFFKQSEARKNLEFDDDTKNAVSEDMINEANRPISFTDDYWGVGSIDDLMFGSYIVDYHSYYYNPTFGPLEGFPHNLVHNRVGGFMGDFLSSVDPIFFMHHANIDRLWKIWSKKQVEINRSQYPTTRNFAKWVTEPFLFYYDDAGKLIDGIAARYIDSSAFLYSYGPGYTPPTQFPAAAVAGGETPPAVTAGIGSSALKLGLAAEASAPVPAGPGRPFARITLDLPEGSKDARFRVFINAEGAFQNAGPAHPNFVASLELFGHHAHKGHAGLTPTFLLPLGGFLAKMERANKKVTGPLKVQVVAQPRDGRGVAAQATEGSPELGKLARVVIGVS
ncbi:MAG: hypothetical protein GC191_07015 [Azospirillum sp.]|nr:hypothetical protein [Azospirillum sp.]